MCIYFIVYIWRYSFDVYVSHIVHYEFETVSPTYLNDCCIGFRLWDYPLIYVQSNDGQSHLNPNQREFEESLRAYANRTPHTPVSPEAMKQNRIRFNSGKSCMFKMTKGMLLFTLILIV